MTKAQSKIAKPKQHIQRHYAPLVLFFLAIALFVGAAVYYLAFIKSVVVVQATPIISTADFTLTADELDAPVVEATINDDTYTYTEFNNTTLVPGIARGEVTIENHYSVDQPLVRTTRLLSKEGVLFHTDETVVVPAGGKIDVPVYADQPGDTGDITPTTFEIVALWQGLKDKIYATSSEAMTGGMVSQNVIAEADVASAKAAADVQVRSKAAAALTTVAQTEVTGITPESVQISVTSQTINPTSGTQSDHITVTTTVHAKALAFTTEKLLNVLQQKFKQDVSVNDMNYTVKTDESGSVVTGTVQLSKMLSAQDVDTAQLTNKTKEEIKSYLEQQPGVKAVPLDTISFSPFWLNTLPANWSNKIIIIIQQ